MFIIAVAGAQADEIDHVLVKKSERQLLLMSGKR